MTPDSTPKKIVSLYKFVTIDDPLSLRSELYDLCRSLDIRGTLLVASEGINGTISGLPDSVESLIDNLTSRFGDLRLNFSDDSESPFLRLKVRVKREIVTLGLPEVDACSNAGDYVSPADWNELVSAPDVVLIDARNAYEVSLGTFDGALNPNTSSFGELPDWLDRHLDSNPDTKVAMFCTGGIRCEKSTALLRQRGYKNVFHLEGGILNYLSSVSESDSLWQGECFVFDRRVSVGHGLKVGNYELCHGCRMPISESEKNDSRYVEGVSCPHCHDTSTSESKRRFGERRNQIELARRRGTPHLGADIESAKASKRKERRKQRERREQRERAITDTTGTTDTTCHSRAIAD